MGVFVLTAVIGNVIIVAQSLHGPGNLFGNGLLGTIFTQPGPQIDYYQYGAFWRSNFPVYFACVWLFFYYAAQAVWSFKLHYLIAVAFFSAAFLLNFSRSLYVGIAVAGLVFVLAAYQRRRAVLRIGASARLAISVHPVCASSSWVPRRGRGSRRTRTIGAGRDAVRLGNLGRPARPSGSLFAAQTGYCPDSIGLRLLWVAIHPYLEDSGTWADRPHFQRRHPGDACVGRGDGECVLACHKGSGAISGYFPVRHRHCHTLLGDN